MGIAERRHTALSVRPTRRAAATGFRVRYWRGLIGAAVWVVSFVAASAGTVNPGPPLPETGGALDRIAFGVDGAESSHGADAQMWRADPTGPQGPMQVSAAAATDVGGGDRFDMTENRMLGRAYLAHLYQRYANWPDAIAAYNWGPGNMDSWIGAGRPTDKFPIGVSLYRIRVLFGPNAALGPQAPHRFGITHPPPRRALADLRHPSRESLAVEQLYGAILADSKRLTRP